MATRVHLADDHTMFRQGLEAILASREGIEVVSVSSTGPGAAERVATTKPDVIVTQLDMQPKTAQEIISGCGRPRRILGWSCSLCGTTCATFRRYRRWA